MENSRRLNSARNLIVQGQVVEEMPMPPNQIAVVVAVLVAAVV